MALTPTGEAALIGREAMRLTAYRDSKGILTISVGVTEATGLIKITPGLTLTRAQAEDLFRRALVQYEKPVDELVKVPLADHERDALVSICYNIGQGAFKRAGFLKKLNAGDRAGCAAAIMQWTKPSEITSRREAERDQFLTPYDRALPKARSNDRKPVTLGKAPIARARPARPVVAPAAAPAPAQAIVEPSGGRPGLLTALWRRLRGRPAVPNVPVVAGTRGDPTLFYVQTTLKQRAYYTRGMPDGIDGPLTRDAVAAVRKDNGMGDGGIDAAFLQRLPSFPQRPVTQERAAVTVKEAAAHAPELFRPASILWKAGLGSAIFGAADGAKDAGLLDTVQQGAAKANDVFGQVQTAMGYVAGGVAFVVEHRALILVGVGIFLVLKAGGYILDGWIKVRQAFF